jgi:hypothetical protein
LALMGMQLKRCLVIMKVLLGHPIDSSKWFLLTSYNNVGCQYKCNYSGLPTLKLAVLSHYFWNVTCCQTNCHGKVVSLTPTCLRFVRLVPLGI